MGRLDVRIVEARNLPNPQSVGVVDPYVKVTLENNTHKTGVIENKTSPTWNEVFKFTVADENSSQLKFEVWNSNVASDDFLGCYSLSLTGLTLGEVKDEWVLLSQCTSNAELHIRLLAVDFGAASAPEPVQVCEPAPVPQMAPPMVAPVPPPQPMMQQQPPPQMPPQMPPPQQQAPPPPAQGGYGAPAYGAPLGGAPQGGGNNAPATQGGAYGAPGGPPQQQPQWGAQPPAQQAQPQWGTPSAPVEGQVAQANGAKKKKGGFGGLLGTVVGVGIVAGKVLSKGVESAAKGLDTAQKVVNEQIGGATSPAGGAPQIGVNKQALWVNQADGFTFAVMDGSLRHIPDANTFRALFPGDVQEHTGMNTFSTAPGATPAPFPFGKPLPPYAHIKSADGELFFIDDSGAGQQCRRHLPNGSAGKYSLVVGQNVRPASLQELEAIPQGAPLA